MLEEPANDRPNPDGFGETGHSRYQTAETADDEIDRHTGTRRIAERGHDSGILALINLGYDVCGTAAAMLFDFCRDQLEETRPHAARSHEQRLERRRI